MNNEPLNDVILQQFHFFSRRTKLPGSIRFLRGEGDTAVMVLSRQDMEANMQSNEAAFEACALLIHVHCGFRVELAAENAPEDLAYRRHYGRFLYRAMKFSDQYSGWFSLSPALKDRVENFRAYLRTNSFCNNVANGPAGPGNRRESRMETLMVSIRSEAAIMGKILAVITFVVTMIASLIIGFAVSYLVTGMFADTSFVSDFLENAGITSETMNLGPQMAAAMIISTLIGCLMLSQIAALSGAGCSSMEDMESANMAATMLIMACYFVTVFAGPFGSGPAVALSLCPFVSAFAAPTYYVTGDISMAVLALSWVIQAACVLVLHILSGKVYDSLVIYKGNRLKLSQILSMAVRKGER